MRLLIAELKKLSKSKTISVVFLVLLSANFILTIYISRPQPYEKTVRTIYNQYLQTPEEIDTYYKELEQISFLNFKGDVSNIPYSYYGSSEYDDIAILKRVYERADYINNGYKNEIRNIIKITERKIDDLYSFNYDDDDYEVISQKAILKNYESLLNELELGKEYSYGYDIYFKNNTVSVFILLCIIINASYIFSNDSSVGFDNILRTTKHGRSKTFNAKILALFVSIFICVMLFSITTLVAIGITQGFSSPLTAIQSLPEFATVPYEITILDLLLIQILFRFLAFLIIALAVSLFSCLKLPYAISIGSGTIAFAINTFFYSRTYLGTVPCIKYINLAAAIETCDLISFFRVLPFFDIPVSYILATFALSIILIVAFTMLCGFIFCKNIRVQRKRRSFEKITQKTIKKFLDKQNKQKSRNKHFKIYPLAIYELKKNRIIIIILTVAVLLGIRGIYVNYTVGTMKTFDQAVYYEYISDIQPLDDISRKKYMVEERDRIDKIINVAQDNKTAFEKGELDAKSYYQYYKVLSDTKSKDMVFKRVEDYVNYIDNKNTSIGGNGEIIYSIGYEKLFGLSSDLFLCVAIMILCIKTFSVEYSFETSRGGFSQILRTTKHGRKHTFFAKAFTFGFLGLLISIAFRTVTILIVSNNYLLPSKDATLYSIQSFSSVTSNITIGQYLFLDYCIQGIVGAILGISMCMMSCILKRTLATISTGIFAIAIPEIMVQTVLPQFSDFSILSLTSSQTIMSNSAYINFWGSNFTYLFLIVLIYIFLCSVLIIIEKNKFCRFNHSYK